LALSAQVFAGVVAEYGSCGGVDCGDAGVVGVGGVWE
jgi:hypothetical protein